MKAVASNASQAPPGFQFLLVGAYAQPLIPELVKVSASKMADVGFPVTGRAEASARL